MSVELVGLALLMAAVTYPWRAVPLLIPGIEQLPGPVLEYLRLIGPAILAAIAGVSALVLVDADGRTSFHIGVEALSVVACVALVARRRNLLLGLTVAVALVAVARYLHLA